MSLQGKTMMSDDFELGREDEMDPMSSVTFSTLLLRASKTGEHLCVFKAYTLFFFFFMTDHLAR